MGYYLKDWDSKCVPQRFMRPSSSIQQLDNKVNMFAHISDTFETWSHRRQMLNMEDPTACVRTCLGDNIIQIVCCQANAPGNYSGNLTVDYDDADFDMCVTTKTDVHSEAATLYDVLACRGSHGPVKLTITGGSLTERDFYALGVWVGDSAAELYLARNQLGEHGTMLLAKNLLNHNLLFLDISHNAIKSEGCLALLHALCSSDGHGNESWHMRCPSLRAVNVRYNEIGEQETDILRALTYRHFDDLTTVGRNTWKFGSGNFLSYESWMKLVEPIFAPSGIPRDSYKAYVIMIRAGSRDMKRKRAHDFDFCDFGKYQSEVEAVLQTMWGYKPIKQKVLEGAFSEFSRFTHHTGGDDNLAKTLSCILSPHAPHIIIMDIGNCKITHVGAQFLADGFSRSLIDTLILTHSDVSLEGKELLQKAWESTGKTKPNSACSRGLYF